ncbi:MAG: 7-cyano-7-deazaguanine synthase QueC [Deltaproteobacteria bacterium]|nr:7-cyano-7-deazaguanine synthase QueC [Deltaproteobacteria bacterium]
MVETSVNRKPERTAVLLLSGGLDSTTTAAMARADGYSIFALTFRYGQRHSHEIDCAVRIAAAMGVKRHEIIDIDLGRLGGSALTGDIPVPKNRANAEMESGIPLTYVPARNTIFLAYALGWAEVLNANDIFIGVNAVDYSGYPDCRPEFIAAFETMANLATRATVQGQRLTIHTPLLHLSKQQIIERGLALGVDYGLTSTCYDPSANGIACGACDACQLRRKGFRNAGLTDPAPYASNEA